MDKKNPASVLDDLTRRGFSEQGVSDPDDMSIVYALETGTGVRGTLTDAFGVYADPRVGAFIGKVARAA